MVEWNIEVGTTLLRRELHRDYGGAWYGGMEPAVKSNSVFLFTNPSEGEAFGYNYDGWQPDGTFHYTGDGQVGTQNPNEGGNAALLAAAGKGRTVRLFRSQGTYTTYLGPFDLLDPPYFVARAPDREGSMRDVLVFRLIPAGEVLHEDVDVAPAPPRLSVYEISLEAANVDSYMAQRPLEPGSATIREAMLVADYAAWLESYGDYAIRQRIDFPDGTSLYTDLYQVESQELVEAKTACGRTFCREGLGQLLDYGRYVDHKSKALLVPERPIDDLVSFLHTYGVVVIWPEDDDFLRSA